MCPSCPRHATRPAPGQLNVWLARKHAGARSVASAILEDAQIGIVDTAPEDELGRLLPSSAATALIKDDLVDSWPGNDPLPLGRVEGPTCGRVLETPRDPVALANTNQAKGKQHELVPKKKTLPIMV